MISFKTLKNEIPVHKLTSQVISQITILIDSNHMSKTSSPGYDWTTGSIGSRFDHRVAESQSVWSFG